MESHAVVPGHITGLFTVERRSDPIKTGSTGAGITIDPGVSVTARTADTTNVIINGEPATIEPVTRVLEDLGVTATIDIETKLPIGAGFGVSGAATLGAALTATAVADGTKTEQELIERAHVAEVTAGTGLGDVVAQARGGIPIRIEPGSDGRLDGIPATGRIEAISLGTLSTPAVLDERPEQITEAGELTLATLLEDPTIEQLFACSQEFAQATGLLAPEVSEVIDAVETAGGTAMMSMLGKTVVALGTGLSDAGYDPIVGQIDHAGARLTQDPNNF